MKLLLATILALAAAVGITRLVQNDAGVAVLSWGGTTIETSLAVTVGVAIAAFTLFYIALRLLSWLWHLPATIRSVRSRRASRRAINELIEGETLLAEGKWTEAEKRLLKHADASPVPLLHHLSAARAAQQQGAHQRRDHHLRLGHHSTPSASIAIALTQAEMQLDQLQTEQAIATLRTLHQKTPKHRQVLNLLARAYEERKEWNELHQLLPQLAKQKVYSKEGMEELTRRTQYHRLDSTRSRTLLLEQWKALPKSSQQDPQLIEVYVVRLVALGDMQQAEEVLVKSIKHQWSDNLIERYGLLDVENIDGMITRGEGWLKSRPDNAVLLMALGRLCLRDRLWGKAREYLEASINSEPSAEAYHLLGQLLERLNESIAAGDCYRKGLEHDSVMPPIPLPDRILPARQQTDRSERN